MLFNLSQVGRALVEDAASSSHHAHGQHHSSLFIGNPGTSVPNGVRLQCFGPLAVPKGARALVKLQPEVNMKIVHHMIMFGGSGEPRSRFSVNSFSCGDKILYAWARTGQTTPIGLDFGDAPGGAAYQVGAGGTGWVALQVHYQQLESPSPLDDKSGVRLSFAAAPPRRPLKVELMMSTSLRIPAGRFQDECVLCRVQQGGAVVAFRNHAHRLARGVWSDHWDANGRPQPPLGNLSAQQAQIVRLLPAERRLGAGDALQLHCQYDGRDSKTVTTLGLDERRQEMCNQYLVGETSLSVRCEGHFGLSRAPRGPPLPAKAGGGAAATIGQVTGVALDGRRGYYFIHRAGNTFASTAPIARGPIVHVPAAGASSGGGGALGGLFGGGAGPSELGAGEFVVPHGLARDHRGYLWATDVALHTVVKLDASTGKVVLRLGTKGRPGRGPHHFNKPTDVAVDPKTERVYVSDGYGNSRVAVFGYDGTFLFEWGTPGRGAGQFRVPHGVAVDGAGDVYVADRENGRVQVFDAKGAYKAEWVSSVLAGAGCPGAGDGGGVGRAGAPFSCHVSSVDYDATLDALVTTEGDGVVIRTKQGCKVASHRGFDWPHDAVLLPSAERGVGRSLVAGAPELFAWVAELDGKRVTALAGKAGGARGGGGMYG